MIEIFKKYCEIKSINSRYGFLKKDTKDKLFVETFEGEKIYDLAYLKKPSKQHPKRYYDNIGELVSISRATCGYTEKCQIGKPQQKCIDDKVYSPNKCAVIFIDVLDLKEYEFNLSIKDFEVLANER